MVRSSSDVVKVVKVAEVLVWVWGITREITFERSGTKVVKGKRYHTLSEVFDIGLVVVFPTCQLTVLAWMGLPVLVVVKRGCIVIRE